MAYLDRFRIIKLSGKLQEEFSLPVFICADPESKPFPEGQAFYRWVIDDNACEPVTAYNYLNCILPFLTFLWFGSPSLRYTASAEQIRHRVRDYLREKLGCAVRPHRNGNFVVKSSSATITATSVRLFLTALKQFYLCAILRGWYTDPNPMMWTTSSALREREFTPQMPPESGMTIPDSRKGRVPDTYFCVVSGEWQPRIIDDANLPKQLLPNFTQLRDQIIARMLFESGARVGEVLDLTMEDWRSREQGERALATNKGSKGRRVKEIWWSSTTSQLLRNYIRHDRRWHDQSRQGLDELPDTARLFITDEGRPYTYDAFYAHWQNACKKAQLRVTPHQARHWFVTMALHKFESLPDEKRAAARQSLIAYMGWRSPDTIKAYDHHLHALDFAPTHVELVRLVEMGNSALAPLPSSEAPVSTAPAPSQAMREWLNQLLSSEE